ncbi:MAG TPA: aldose 1-epimerase family protein [Rubrobacteraceae bacterium]|nr:aldose 1-epimerase family protein [Rubrobacteraceae bacterium]
MSSRELVTIHASSGLAASIDPHGAQLVSLKTAGGPEIIWQGDPRTWPDHALILFPLISQVPGGHIHHQGCDYPMPPHGFAHSREFDLSYRTGSSCAFELRDDEQTRAQYPFAFRLSIEFDLSDDGLLVTISVENPNGEPMPADVGFHPGFNWPLTPGRLKDEYSIVFDEDEPAPVRRGGDDPVLLYPDGVPTPVEGNVLRPRDELFEGSPIVFDQLASKSLTYGARGDLSLRIDFPDSPDLALWMIPGANYLCIEPWQGYPALMDFDGPLTEKPGIAVIEPDETRRWRVGLTLQPASEPHVSTGRN